MKKDIDIIGMRQALHALRVCTRPIEGHDDPGSIDDCFNELQEQINIIDAYLKSTSPLDEALNSGDGIYKP